MVVSLCKSEFQESDIGATGPDVYNNLADPNGKCKQNTARIGLIYKV